MARRLPSTERKCKYLHLIFFLNIFLFSFEHNLTPPTRQMIFYNKNDETKKKHISLSLYARWLRAHSISYPIKASSDIEHRFLHSSNESYAKAHFLSNRFSVSGEFQIFRFVQSKQVSLEIDFHVTVCAAVLMNMECEQLHLLEHFAPKWRANDEHFHTGRKAVVCCAVVAINALQ